MPFNSIKKLFQTVYGFFFNPVPSSGVGGQYGGSVHQGLPPLAQPVETVPKAISWPSKLSVFQIKQIAEKIDQEHFGGFIRDNLGASFCPTIIYIESSGRVDAVRDESSLKDQSVGLMQLLNRTAEAMIERGYKKKGNDLFDAETNVYLGCAFIKYLWGKVPQSYQDKGKNKEFVIKAYNGGEKWYLKDDKVKKNVQKYYDKFISVEKNFI
ncbi:MAG: transglycosylase SLT domain-containing protein [Candidatus Babeliales bacterium]